MRATRLLVTLDCAVRVKKLNTKLPPYHQNEVFWHKIKCKYWLFSWAFIWSTLFHTLWTRYEDSSGQTNPSIWCLAFDNLSYKRNAFKTTNNWNLCLAQVDLASLTALLIDIFLMVRRSPKMSWKALVSATCADTGIEISRTTIGRVVRFYKVRRWKAKQRISLSRKDAKEAFAWSTPNCTRLSAFKAYSL